MSVSRAPLCFLEDICGLSIFDSMIRAKLRPIIFAQAIKQMSNICSHLLKSTVLVDPRDTSKRCSRCGQMATYPQGGDPETLCLLCRHLGNTRGRAIPTPLS